MTKSTRTQLQAQLAQKYRHPDDSRIVRTEYVDIFRLATNSERHNGAILVTNEQRKKDLCDIMDFWTFALAQFENTPEIRIDMIFEKDSDFRIKGLSNAFEKVKGLRYNAMTRKKSITIATDMGRMLHLLTGEKNLVARFVTGGSTNEDIENTPMIACTSQDKILRWVLSHTDGSDAYVEAGNWFTVFKKMPVEPGFVRVNHKPSAYIGMIVEPAR